MKATRKFLSDETFGTSEDETNLIEAIQLAFSELKVTDVIQKKSEAISRFFSSLHFGEKFQVAENCPITLTDEPGKVRANMRIDKVFKLTNVSSTRFVNVELALNNREAAGTNLLKLEVMSQIQSARGSTSSLGILICLTNGLKETAGMDKSYATASDYTEFMSKAWKVVIKSRIILIELHDV